ncbi:hypothetical protein QQ045_008361 [Rhodiola kirilowii]
MEQIEDECQTIMSKIETLNKTLEILTKASSNSPRMLLAGDPQLIMGVSKSVMNGTDKFGIVPQFPWSELPRFMQPTVCSRRKSGIELTLFEEKSRASARRRRRSITQRANSVSFPLKRKDANSSDCSTSITSCVENSNVISNVDNETEPSQCTSECDIKTIDFHICRNIPKFVSHRTSHQNQKPTIGNNSLRSKWVSRLPIQEGNFRVREQNKKEGLPLPGHESRSFEFPVTYDETEKMVEDQSNESPSIESPKKSATDMSTILCHKTDGETGTQFQSSVNSCPEVDIGCSISNMAEATNKCSTTDDNEKRREPTPGIYKDIKCSKNHTLNQTLHSRACQCKQYAGDVELYGNYLSMQVMGVRIPKAHSDIIPKKCSLERMDASFQGLSKETTKYAHRSQSHRALFTDKLEQDKVNTLIVHPRVCPQSTGLLVSIKLKIQMLYFCALMWLGFRNLGYDDDFFHSLTR